MGWLRPGFGPVHLLVDSTGLKLCHSGEWLLEKHGTKTRRSWRKLHIGVDAGTGQIAAAVLTSSDVDDASEVGPLLDQVDGPVASFTADGAYDQDGVYAEVAARHPEASVIVPLRFSAVQSDTAQTVPTMRERHLHTIAKHGCMAWQKTSGYDWRALVEADIIAPSITAEQRPELDQVAELIAALKAGERAGTSLAHREAESQGANTAARDANVIAVVQQSCARWIALEEIIRRSKPAGA